MDAKSVSPARVTVRHSGRESDPMLAELAAGRGGRVRELIAQMDRERVAQHMQSSLVGAAAAHSRSYSHSQAVSSTTARNAAPSPAIAIGERVQNARRAAESARATASAGETSAESAEEAAAAAVAAAVEEAAAAADPDAPQGNLEDPNATGSTGSASVASKRPEDPLAQYSDKTLEEKKKALAMLKQVLFSFNHDPENENADAQPAAADANAASAADGAAAGAQEAATGEIAPADAVPDADAAGEVPETGATDAGTEAEKPPE